jgi:hypothetical protein
MGEEARQAGKAADGVGGGAYSPYPVRGLVEAVLPARMGTPFRWLVGSSWVTNLGDGDGVALAAGPPLVAGPTQDPLLIALGALLQRLP